MRHWDTAAFRGNYLTVKVIHRQFTLLFSNEYALNTTDVHIALLKQTQCCQYPFQNRGFFISGVPKKYTDLVDPSDKNMA